MELALQLGLDSIETLEDGVDVLQVVHGQSLELLDSLEQINELGNSSAEQVELSENLVRREFELLSLRHAHQSFLGQLVLLLVSVVKINAALKNGDKFIWGIFVVIPKFLSVDLVSTSSSLSSGFVILLSFVEVQNVVLAVLDHLGGNLDEESSHLVVGVVVPGNGVDHLDRVHQSREGVLNGLWGAFVKGLNELLKGSQVLDIVLGLVEGLSDLEFKTSPLGGKHVDLVS